MSKERLSANDQLSLDEGSEAWDALSAYLSSFLEAWESGDEPPRIADFAPASPPALRRMVLVELVKIDLEQRRQGAAPPRSIEEYGQEFPELLGEKGLPCDLVYEEFHVRQQAGEAVSYEEYLDRFPGQAQSLRRMFGLRSTRMLKQTRAGPESIEYRPGQEVDDFEILGQLGMGAFAKVFLARQRSMQRRVALKVCLRESDEPQTMAQLDHGNIVRVFDQRHVPDRDIQLIYMEYVAGGNLKSVVDKVRRTPPTLRSGAILVEVVDQALAARSEEPSTGPWRERLSRLSWGETVCWLGAQLASALDYAHSHGTLHRDLKPANVLLTIEGAPKLVDFNVSYSSKLEGASPVAYFGGSLGYMAPEHIEAYSPYHERGANELDGRSDLYSLGILLWELLTGTRPFPDEAMEDDWEATLRAMIARRRAGIPPSALEQLPHTLPPGLREALLRALEPDPENRFSSAGEMARELRLCLNPEVCSARQHRSGRWYPIVRRHVLLAAIVVGLGPNAVLSVANVLYDFFAIVGPRLPESAQIVFLGTLTTLVKAILYGIGLVVGVKVAWTAVRPLWMKVSADQVLRARRRSLWLGDMVFWVSMGAWGISGILFPAWIDWSVPGAIHTGDYLHFLASHLLCGLIAGTMSFFLMALLAVRVLYPGLLEIGPAEEGAEQSLLALRGRLVTYSRLAVVVPFLAAVTLGIGDPGFRPAFAGLAVLGLGILLVTVRLLPAIQMDLGALVAAVAPEVPQLSVSTSRVGG